MSKIHVRTVIRPLILCLAQEVECGTPMDVKRERELSSDRGRIAKLEGVRLGTEIGRITWFYYFVHNRVVSGLATGYLQDDLLEVVCGHSPRYLSFVVVRLILIIRKDYIASDWKLARRIISNSTQ